MANNQVELVGEELVEFKKEVDRQRRLRDEALQRKKRQNELMLVTDILFNLLLHLTRFDYHMVEVEHREGGRRRR